MTKLTFIQLMIYEKHPHQLVKEIQSLNEHLQAKEVQWNILLHLRKITEEICFRLTRKTQLWKQPIQKLVTLTNILIVLIIIFMMISLLVPRSIKVNHKVMCHQKKKSTSTPIIGTAATAGNFGYSNFSIFSSSGDGPPNNPTQPTISCSGMSTGTNAINPFTSSGTTTAQSISQLRANMESSDLG